VPLVLRGFLYLRMEVKLMAKKEIHIDCPQCGTPLDIEENIEDESSQSNTVWWDTGDKVVLIPREMLKYLEDSQGVLGFS